MFNGSDINRLKRGMKASIPGVPATFHQSHDIRHFDTFSAGSVQLKKPSVGPKGLIGPPCHGAPETLIKIDGVSQMRRRIEVLLGMKKIVRRKVWKSPLIHIVKIKKSSFLIFLIIAVKHLFLTSFEFLDSFFSSLPLPMARVIIATDFHKTKKMETTEDTEFLKFFISVTSVILSVNFLFFWQEFISTTSVQQCMMRVFKGLFWEPFFQLPPFHPSTPLWLRPQAAL
jgi:hypothetical protein